MKVEVLKDYRDRMMDMKFFRKGEIVDQPEERAHELSEKGIVKILPTEKATKATKAKTKE